jgi:hypothetical protein
MRFDEIKQRLDPACWDNKKIGNPKTKIKGGVRVNNCVPKEGVAEAFGLYGPFTVTINTGERPQSRTKTKKFKREDDAILWAQDWLEDAPQYVFATAEVTDPDGNVVWTTDEQGVAEAYNAEYDDEAGMADNNLSTLRRAVDGLDDLIDSGDNLPEWCQEKIAVAKSMLVSVWDYMESADDSEEEFDLIESIIDRIAAQNRVDAEMVWEDLESLSHDELYAFAVTSQLNEDWSKVNKKDKTDGMSQKAVNAYRRENPGSKLKTAVTTKPSKLKKGSKASKRRKSYCSRSKGQMNMHNISCAKTPDKAICKARRRWNC